ncbi:hypothetical protein CNMCM7691_008328 [Aspergillus felis]|uniref:Protein kinase domain-containing protein n=1 Tax=Aspergillus felis TaxID=1287682 RepID=A0A8H6V695_9EURO|nr:hypothetical protein CNMCM7691_008328 [Aspergillus felis]
MKVEQSGGFSIDPGVEIARLSDSHIRVPLAGSRKAGTQPFKAGSNGMHFRQFADSRIGAAGASDSGLAVGGRYLESTSWKNVENFLPTHRLTCTETDRLKCSLRAYKRSDDVPCYSNEAGPSGKERTSLALDTLKTAKTGTTASTSPQSVFSCPQPRSSSSSLSNPAPKQAALNLASISLRGLFRRLDTKVDGLHKSQSALDISTEDDANSINEQCESSSSGVVKETGRRLADRSDSSLIRAKSRTWGTIPDHFEIPGFSIPLDGKGKSPLADATLPEAFTVHSCKLGDEFVDTSIIPGLRGKVIGKGVTATVKLMHGKGPAKQDYFAVKEFRRSRKESLQAYDRKIKLEFSIAKSLHHPNIVETVRLCSQAGRWSHVMEYCSQGDLFTIVQQRYLSFESQLCLFRQLFQGVAYLHDIGIAHRDIKLENLLLTGDSHLKITDFGCARVFRESHRDLRSNDGGCAEVFGKIRKCGPGVCGSLPYIAPEVLAEDRSYDPRLLDIWSCAIVCLAMLHCGTPWAAAEEKDAGYSRYLEWWEEFLRSEPDGIITGDVYPKIGKFFSDLRTKPLRRLMLRMLHPIPERRATICDVMNDRWVKRIECCCPEPGKPSNCFEEFDGIVYPKVHNHLPPAKKGFFQRYI